ncbi:MAG TPA: hypothetical protein VGG34_05325 [Opitutaceae bacterium]|jgi:hypothetical protein
MTAKRTAITAAAAAAAAAALAVSAFLPGVQAWAARRVLRDRAGPSATLAAASFGPGTALLAGLRAESGGAVLTAPLVQAHLDVVRALLGRRYRVGSLVARGWTLDLSHLSAPPAAGREPGYPWLARALGGAIAAFRAHAGLVLGTADLEGDILLPGGRGRAPATLHVHLKGGGLAPGATGRFSCEAQAVSTDPAAPVSTVGLSAVLSVSMDASGAFDRADLRADATAEGRDVPAGIGLSCAGSASRSAGRDAFSLSLFRAGQPVASIDAAQADGSPAMAGTWKLDLRDTDLAPFALGRSLPAFYAAGGGSYEADPPSGDVRVKGSLRATLDRLGVIRSRLSALGRVAVSAQFDVARRGPSLRVERLDTSVSSGQEVASVRALQSFEFNRASGELKVAAPADDLVGISVRALPLAWLQVLAPRLSAGGGAARGELVLRAEDGRLALRTRAPLTADGVSLSAGGRPVLSGVSASAFVVADYAAQGWQLQLAPLSLRTQGIEMLAVEARLGRLSGHEGALKAAGSWSASLPLLLSMPALRALPRLTAGDASGSFEASLGEPRAVDIRMALKGLAADGAGPIPAVSSELRVEEAGAGRYSFGAPVHLDYGTRSADLRVTGSAAAHAPFDAAVSSPALDADDLMALCALSAGAAPAAAPGSAAAAPRPFWPAATGRVAFDIARLALPKAEFSQVRGVLGIAPDSLSLGDASAQVGEGGTLRASGTLGFMASGQPGPYTLAADFSAAGVEAGPYLAAASPGRPPVVEGAFDAVGEVSSSGEARDLLRLAQADVRLTSRGGHFRALDAGFVEQVRQAPSRLVGAIDSVSALFGKKTENLGTALVESAKALADIRYDQMSLSAHRAGDLDIAVGELTLLSPEVRIGGTARITHVDGVPVRDQPLSVDLDVAARGQLAKFLDTVGMLKDGQDGLGYTPLYQGVHLGGTLSHVDQSQWKEMLEQAPLRRGSGLIDKLLGK